MVERTLGKGEVESSILSRGTILHSFAAQKFLIQWIKNRGELCFLVLIARTGCASGMDRAQGCSQKFGTYPVERI